MKYIKLIALSILAIVLTNCELDTFPHDSLSKDDFGTLANIQLLSTGIYSQLSSGDDQLYLSYGNHSSDDFAKLNRIANKEPGSFTTNVFDLLSNGTNSWPIWKDCYKSIHTCNVVIAANSFGTNAEMNNSLAEMYFLRAYNYYILSTLFTRPYTQKDISDLGLPMRLDPDDVNEASRSTIDVLYQQMISDLKIASLYMSPLTTNRTKASKQAAQALLARIYNSMLQPTNPDAAIASNALLYADSVLLNSGGKVTMVTSAATFFGSATVARTQWPSKTTHYFQTASGSSETIWMHIRPSVISLAGCLDYEFNQSKSGQYLPLSNDYYDMLNKYPVDLRNNLIDKSYTTPTGTTLVLADAAYNARSTNCNKYSFQSSILNLGSMIVLRATEMCLIKAEIYAKQGNVSEALKNINLVRKRASVPEFTEANWTTNAYGITNLLDLVLNEKRLEMVGENLRRNDIYRNKKDIIRMYGFDSSNYLETYPSGGTGTISRWNSKVIITPIPYGQMLQSPNMVQNPY